MGFWQTKRGWFFLALMTALCTLLLYGLIAETGLNVGVPRHISHFTNKSQELAGVYTNLLIPDDAANPEEPTGALWGRTGADAMGPPKSPPSYEAMTSSYHSKFFISNPKLLYNVGDRVSIRIETRTDRNEPKTVGGDYFRARITTLEKHASLSTDGEVADLQNGWYEANFTLRWPGRSVVTVVLVQPAEALDVVQEIAENHPAKMVYIGKFVKDSTAEIRRCNVLPPLFGQICNFSNPIYDVPWYCQAPRDPRLSCRDWRWSQSDEEATAKLQKSIFGAPHRAVPINRFREPLVNDQKVVSVTVEAGNQSATDMGASAPQTEFAWQKQLPPCCPGQHIGQPHPSGYYYQDTWYSLHCKIRRHWTLQNMTSCLRNTTVCIIGDSSSRQIYELLSSIFKNQLTHKRTVFEYESEQRSGPLWSIDAVNNIDIRYNFHGFPIGGSRWFNVSTIMDMASRLDSIQTYSSKLVLILTIGAHYTYHSLDVYERRLHVLKAAIGRLYSRIPEAVVIVKSMTPREHSHEFHKAINSEWWMRRLDLSMRRIIASDPRIALLDAWDMTRAMLYPLNVHPHERVISNYISHILSYVCPLGSP